MYVPSQWEMTLHCNVVSHWLGTYSKWSLNMPCTQDPDNTTISEHSWDFDPNYRHTMAFMFTRTKEYLISLIFHKDHSYNSFIISFTFKILMCDISYLYLIKQHMSSIALAPSHFLFQPHLGVPWLYWVRWPRIRLQTYFPYKALSVF